MATHDGLVQASFRDPGGRLFVTGDGRVIRVVNPAIAKDVGSFITARLADRLMRDGKLVGTRQLAADDLSLAVEELGDGHAVELTGSLVLEHERIPLASYPYEWSPSMLYDAAALTLELAEMGLREGFGLKDATPYNVLYHGPSPVFVDILSFERRNPRDSLWLPYAQFARTFLLPLLEYRYFRSHPAQVFLARRDGLEPADVAQHCSLLQKLRPPFLGLVTLPVLLAGRATRKPVAPQPQATQSEEKARFILSHLLRHLRGVLARLRPVAATSTWTGYMQTNSYSSAAFSAKEEFVVRALADVRPASVLDVGCNTGHFSAIAARTGARVVAIDNDPDVCDRVFLMARAEQLNVLPLLVDIARPSPAVGWRNAECASFLERVEGQFDCVLMLAVLHHLLVHERIPLADIIDLAARLTTEHLVIEFVAPADPMFVQLSHGRGVDYSWFTDELFEDELTKHFDVISRKELDGGTRHLYVARKRNPARFIGTDAQYAADAAALPGVNC